MKHRSASVYVVQGPADRLAAAFSRGWQLQLYSVARAMVRYYSSGSHVMAVVVYFVDLRKGCVRRGRHAPAGITSVEMHGSITLPGKVHDALFRLV